MAWLPWLDMVCCCSENGRDSGISPVPIWPNPQLPTSCGGTVHFHELDPLESPPNHSPKPRLNPLHPLTLPHIPPATPRLQRCQGAGRVGDIGEGGATDSNCHPPPSTTIRCQPLPTHCQPTDFPRCSPSLPPKLSHSSTNQDLDATPPRRHAVTLPTAKTPYPTTRFRCHAPCRSALSPSQPRASRRQLRSDKPNALHPILTSLTDRRVSRTPIKWDIVACSHDVARERQRSCSVPKHSGFQRGEGQCSTPSSSPHPTPSEPNKCMLHAPCTAQRTASASMFAMQSGPDSSSLDSAVPVDPHPCQSCIGNLPCSQVSA